MFADTRYTPVPPKIVTTGRTGSRSDVRSWLETPSAYEGWDTGELAPATRKLRTWVKSGTRYRYGSLSSTNGTSN